MEEVVNTYDNFKHRCAEITDPRDMYDDMMSFHKTKRTEKIFDIEIEYDVLYFCRDKRLCRKKGPSIIIENDFLFVPRIEIYCNNKIIHREDGPAIIEKIGDRVVKEEYFKNNVYHRRDGPAIIIYDLDGKIIETFFYIDGKLVE